MTNIITNDGFTIIKVFCDRDYFDDDSGLSALIILNSSGEDYEYLINTKKLGNDHYIDGDAVNEQHPDTISFMSENSIDAEVFLAEMKSILVANSDIKSA